MATLCVAVACDSNTRRRLLQTRRKSYEKKRTLQPLPQARIQASAEGITPTNVPPRSRISQDPKRSSVQGFDSQVKQLAKRTRLQRHLPVSLLNSAVPHTSLPLTVNLHTLSLSYIHSLLTFQSLPARFDRPLASSLQTSLTIYMAMNDESARVAAHTPKFTMSCSQETPNSLSACISYHLVPFSAPPLFA